MRCMSMKIQPEIFPLAVITNVVLYMVTKFWMYSGGE